MPHLYALRNKSTFPIVVDSTLDGLVATKAAVLIYICWDIYEILIVAFFRLSIIFFNSV